ncbi:MAG: methionyl-tRNA formyltransferase [Planctomycetes bacterium RBG_16_59_8]|nr:MAG: methionyl-tRNA formyltransferase [Planctomycetes bacterium RBG_16_59_8]
MRILFLGTSSFALPALKALAESGHTLLSAVTQPDRPAGRGLHPQPSAVKRFALDRSIPLLQPEDIHHPDSLDRLRALKPEIAVVASYGVLLRKSLLELPVHGCINIHASLLPAWRGAAPVARAIMSGEPKTGVAIFRIVRKLDAGPILGVRETEISPTETRGALEERLANLGAGLLLETLREIESGSIRESPQDEGLATYAHKIAHADGRIDWHRSCTEIANLVRAFQPDPGAFARFRHGSREAVVTVIEASPVAEGGQASAGKIVGISAEGIAVACGGGGALLLRRLQPESKRPMSAADLANGYRLRVGDCLIASDSP